MRIGVIGSGNLGATLAQLFAKAGHEVAISNSRGPETLSELVKGIGERTHPATIEEAASFGEVVILAIPFSAYETLPAAQLIGKIVVDATNYSAARDGKIDLGGLGSSEVISRSLPDARIVKAFNTMYYETLQTGGDRTDTVRLVLFLAGDDTHAKQVVSRLIEQIGFDPVDNGSLQDGRMQQPGSPVYNVKLTRKEAHETMDWK